MASRTEYTSWSNDKLIRRVAELENQLRTLHDTYSRPESPPAGRTKKPKKAPSAFDPSKYNTRRIALKFAYLGSNYNGFEHHSNNKTPLPTVEEELWRALKKTKLIFPACKPGQSEDLVCWNGCDYSKCGRTDRGVSAFGQVIGLRVRSARPLDRRKEGAKREFAQNAAPTHANGDNTMSAAVASDEDPEPSAPKFDPIKDELPYVQCLNRVLPPDIRMLAWCPHPPSNFDARFSCKERRYRYFFTNPGYLPLPGSARGDGWLDIAAMQTAAAKLKGLHDFRNLCKVDPSKQITGFQRRIFHAGIHRVGPEQESGAFVPSETSANGELPAHSQSPHLYYLEVRGSAFLWHQVRHLVAVIFLVGQGYEKPSIVDKLMDVEHCPSKPMYEMANDTPLVLWDCIFPDSQQLNSGDHVANDAEQADIDQRRDDGYVDGLDWIYAGDENGGRDQGKRSTPGVEDGKCNRNGLMEDLWALWRKRKMDEVLAGSLMNIVAAQGSSKRNALSEANAAERSARIFGGSETPRMVGKYVPLMQRERMETPEVVNARYATRKGFTDRKSVVDIDE